MLTENEIRKAVEKVLEGLHLSDDKQVLLDVAPQEQSFAGGEALPDITATPISEQFYVVNPANKDGFMEMKRHTPARIGAGRAGTRHNTFSMLRFRADHATAQDSVFSDVSAECVVANGFVAGQTCCGSRDEYVTRPDLGRKLSPEAAELFRQKLPAGTRVLLMVGDGLSSAAVEANAKDIIPAIKQGLHGQGIEIGAIPFLKYCRVAAMDEVAQVTGAELVCLLIGERPGLVTGESMSAYIAYKPQVGMPESRRTVVSNIHKLGTPPVEAGAHVASLIGRILQAKVSGVDFKV